MATRKKRCIIPAASFDEPNWETGKNVWWRFRRADGMPWGLDGLWDTWTDHETGLVWDSYTMLTMNADGHRLRFGQVAARDLLEISHVALDEEKPLDWLTFAGRKSWRAVLDGKATPTRSARDADHYCLPASKRPNAR
jgi:putative SOS response-associated peptidase YedK